MMNEICFEGEPQNMYQIPVLSYSSTAWSIFQNAQTSERNKSNALSFYQVKESVMNTMVCMKYVKTKMHPANVAIKSLRQDCLQTLS